MLNKNYLPLYLLFLISCGSQNRDQEVKANSELTVKTKEDNLTLEMSDDHVVGGTNLHDTLSGIRAFAASLSEQYDSVVFFTKADDHLLFYVINGNWEHPYQDGKQHDRGDYKMGVVTAENKVIIPVLYTKVYNPNGTFKGMIEVEHDGRRGLYRLNGEAFLPAEFDGIYPTSDPDAFAQVKKGEDYGWVATNGAVSFDPASHPNKNLFSSPIETQAILEWEFKYPGAIHVLIDPYADPEVSTGVIIYPSFIREFGITSIANTGVMLETSEFGMGMTDTVIKFEKVESLTNRLFGLISFFMEAGADARGYHSTHNDLLVIDKDLNKISHYEKLITNDYGQSPCSDPPMYKAIGAGVYESKDAHGFYNYYKITAAGAVEQLETNRHYNFTKFAKINESYFKRCQFEVLSDDGQWEPGSPNVIVTTGMTMEELDIMRNEIFADYGFIFKSQKWKAYFDEKPWYKPLYDNVDQFLTETDKHNIKFLLQYQRLHKDHQVRRDSIQFMWAG